MNIHIFNYWDYLDITKISSKQIIFKKLLKFLIQKQLLS